MPDEWLFSPGQPYHYKAPATNNGRSLKEREPTASEQRAIDDIQRQFGNLASKAILLGDGDKIVKIAYKSPASDSSTFLSASVDKTVTAMSAGVAVCDGKIKLSTKAKEVLPELAGTDIGESTLRDNLLMASGTTNALDDSQSLNRDEHAGVIKGTISFMDLIKGRLGKQQGWQKPGEKFSYKTQDPTLVGMMVSAAYGKKGKDFREWQAEHLFSKVKPNDRYFQGQDQYGYAWAEGNTRMTIRDWARFAVFVQEARKQSDCYGNYVKEATTTQIRTDNRFARMYDGYGYLTWTDNRDIPNSYTALGYGGQAIVWSTTSDKYFIVFSNNINPPEIHGMAKAWLESK
jgi:CubicO group peptidase (beta-lactamase class C family)